LKPHPSWEKVDGWRILAYKDGDRVRLISRNGRDRTRRFSDIAAAVAKLSARMLVLDGEVDLRSEVPVAFRVAT
jgi:bifunctional non-homologous end joining protein LigD